MAQDQIVPLAGAAQVQVAILEAKSFVHGCLFVDVERRRLRLGEHFQFVGEQFNGPRGQLGVGGSCRTDADFAAHGDDKLSPQFSGDDVGSGGAVRVEDHLGQAVAVAEIDEYEAAMVTTTVHPTIQHHLAAGVLYA